MDANAVYEENVSVDGFNSVDPEAGSIQVDLLEGISSSGEMIGKLGPGEVLTRVELDLACFSEKLVNLNVLTMRVATWETDFESFASEKENMLADSVEKALEFDLLSAFLDSEVREADKFIAILQMEIVNARELISSSERLGDTYLEMEEKLRDSEESLKQSRDQVSEMKMQSAKFQRTLSCLHGEGNCKLQTSLCLIIIISLF